MLVKIEIFWLKSTIMNFGSFRPFLLGGRGGGFLIVLGTSEPNFSFLVIFSVLEADSSLPYNKLLAKDSAVVSSRLFSTDSLLGGQIYKAGTHINLVIIYTNLQSLFQR